MRTADYDAIAAVLRTEHGAASRLPDEARSVAAMAAVEHAVTGLCNEFGRYPAFDRRRFVERALAAPGVSPMFQPEIGHIGR